MTLENHSKLLRVKVKELIPIPDKVGTTESVNLEVRYIIMRLKDS